MADCFFFYRILKVTRFCVSFRRGCSRKLGEDVHVDDR